MPWRLEHDHSGISKVSDHPHSAVHEISLTTLNRRDSDMVHHSKGSAAVASNVLAAGKALTDGLAMKVVLVMAFLYALLV